MQATGEGCANRELAHGDGGRHRPGLVAPEPPLPRAAVVGGEPTPKSVLDGPWWQFRSGDAEPVLFPLPGDTYLIGVVVGGTYGERFYRPGKRGTKGRKG